MPASRFSQVSRYRNATLVTGKPHERCSELNLGQVPDNGLGRLLALTPASSHILARSSASPNTLMVLPSDAPRKYGKQPPVLHNVCGGGGGGVLGDFDTCRFQTDSRSTLLAAGSTSGSITLKTVGLPCASSKEVALHAQHDATGESTLTTTRSTAVNALHFHPTSPSLLLSASAQDGFVELWDAQEAASIAAWQAPSPHWDVKWSVDGRLVAGASKDACVRLWDARSTDAPIASINAHQSKVKPTKVTFITAQTSHLLLTTGFSQMRQREVAIWDHRNAASAVHRVTLDVSSSGLEPICDHDRGMVYFVAKGESSMRWIDAGSQDQGASFAEGVYPLDVSAASAALASPSTCDTGTGEIAKLFIASSASAGGVASSSDVIVPSSVRVPRRNYIDFHADLYPDTVDRSSLASTVSAAAWKEGQDATLSLVSMDPAASKPKRQEAVSAARATETTTQEASTRTPASKPTDSEAASAPAAVTKAHSQAAVATVPPLTRQEISASQSSSPRVVEQRQPEKRNITDHHAGVSLKEHESTSSVRIATPPHSAHWSRRPMAGSTPLVAAHQNLASLDIARGPDARMLAVSRRFFFLPIAGPGGRLGVHPIDAQGRLPLHLPYFAHGVPLTDFAVDPFNDDQVITAAADGTIRLWRVPEPVKGERGLELPAEQLDDGCMLSSVHVGATAKIAEIVAHPYVQGLVAILPSDAEGQLTLVDVQQGTILSRLSSPGSGLFSGAWSFDGSVLAVSGKDRMVYVLDLRASNDQARTLGKAKAHDSPRSFRPVWIDGVYLLTVGHTIGSLRQLKLYSLESYEDDGIEEIAKQTMDASPSILFPHWDADTNILWLWSKGERIVSSFEVQPDAHAAAEMIGGAGRSTTALSMAQQQQQDIFTVLPAFQHAQPQLGLAFLPKDCVDVRAVEVASALRLSKTDVHRVSWSVPRSRPEFFQDDVFPPTLASRQPLLTTNEWLAGKDVDTPPRTSLRPDSMTPLSQAPPPEQRQSNLTKGPTVRAMTEKEQEDAMFKDIFSKAKGHDGERDPNHNEEQAARAPDNDDWDDDE